jgi:hypothetical protein
VNAQFVLNFLVEWNQVAMTQKSLLLEEKVPSGKPGMVIYHTYKTVIANPYPDIVLDALNAE